MNFETIDSSKLPLGQYYLLRAYDPEARRYVASLIASGSLTVRESQSWNTKSNVAMGKDILYTIEQQLKNIFSATGLPEPQFTMSEVNRVQRPMPDKLWRLMLEPSSRVALYGICREKYKAQKYTHPDVDRWAQALISLQPYTRL